MLKFYQREGCPHCAYVRRYMTEQGIDFQAINVTKLGFERKDVLALKGVDKPEVPVLVDGEVVIQGSDEIVAWLRETRPNFYGDPAIGLTRTLPGVAYADAIERVTAALASEGFGVLTEIDVKATMKKKLDADFRPYIILGACNPPIALQALTALPAVGLLLPCNVVVTENDAGDAVVSTIDPVKLFEVVKQPAAKPLAREVRGRLVRVMAAI